MKNDQHLKGLSLCGRRVSMTLPIPLLQTHTKVIRRLHNSNMQRRICFFRKRQKHANKSIVPTVQPHVHMQHFCCVETNFFDRPAHWQCLITEVIKNVFSLPTTPKELTARLSLEHAIDFIKPANTLMHHSIHCSIFAGILSENDSKRANGLPAGS